MSSAMRPGTDVTTERKCTLPSLHQHMGEIMIATVARWSLAVRQSAAQQAPCILFSILVNAMTSSASAAPLYDFQLVKEGEYELMGWLSVTSLSNTGIVGVFVTTSPASTHGFVRRPDGSNFSGSGDEQLRFLSINTRGDMAVEHAEIYGLHPYAAVIKDGKTLRLPIPKNAHDVGVFGDSGYSAATAINDFGWIAGVVGQQYSDPLSRYANHAVLWRNGVVIELDRPTDSSSASDINNRGQVVGSVNDRAFMWQQGALRRLATPQGNVSFAEAINDSGDAVGWSRPSGPRDPDTSLFPPSHAVMWHAGVLTMLPAGSDSVAHDINNEGVIVGSSDGHAVMWLNGEMIDLSSVTASIDRPMKEAVRINEAGQIAGNTEDGLAFLLTPIPGGLHTFALLPAPEPQTWLFMGGGIICLGLVMRIRLPLRRRERVPRSRKPRRSWLRSPRKRCR
jgi:uncharacterized membrane protein